MDVGLWSDVGIGVVWFVFVVGFGCGFCDGCFGYVGVGCDCVG